jgi:hypothetical protein
MVDILKSGKKKKKFQIRRKKLRTRPITMLGDQGPKTTLRILFGWMVQPLLGPSFIGERLMLNDNRIREIKLGHIYTM